MGQGARAAGVEVAYRDTYWLRRTRPLTLGTQRARHPLELRSIAEGSSGRNTAGPGCGRSQSGYLSTGNPMDSSGNSRVQHRLD